jgi:hypothetical protein
MRIKEFILYGLNCNKCSFGSIQIVLTQAQNDNQNPQGRDAIDDQILEYPTYAPPSLASWGLTLIGALIFYIVITVYI